VVQAGDHAVSLPARSIAAIVGADGAAFGKDDFDVR